MVNEVTYSMLEKMAAANGRGDVEAFAKEQGFSEAQIAEMKLKEAKFGGEPDAPVDAAQFSYKKVDINGIKGLLTLYGFNNDNGNIKLSAEARKQLKEFGITGITAKDGELYAEHKDGTAYLLSNATDYDLAEVERQAANKGYISSALTAMKGAAVAVLALINPAAAGVVGTAAAAAACDKKDDVTDYKFENTNNTNINVSVKAELNSVENLVKELMEQLGVDLSAILSEITALRSDNNANQEAIIKLLDKIMKIITEGNQTLTDIKNSLVKNHKDDVQYQEKVLQMLGDIKAALAKIDSRIANAYTGIVNAIVNSGAKLENIEKLLRQINANVENLGKLVTRYGDAGLKLGNAILEAIKKLDFNTTVDLSGIEALLKQLVDGQKANGDKIDILTDLFAKASKKAIEMLACLGGQLSIIIDKLDKNSPDYTAQLNAIIKLLEQLDANNEARNQKVLDAIAKLGTDVTGDLTAILAAINALPHDKQKDYTDVLNAILDKIKEGNAQNDANFKAVLAKIHDLGINVAYGMNAILDAIKDMPDYTAKLDAILAKMDALEGKTTENGNTLVDILNAIKDLKDTINIVIEGDKIKVICNCGNCGGNKHEGIIGDLNNLLG